MCTYILLSPLKEYCFEASHLRKLDKSISQICQMFEIVKLAALIKCS